MDTDGENYQSGPFCRHWHDAYDCPELCASCGHKCTKHGTDPEDSACLIDTCNCKAWKDKNANS